MGEDLEFLWVEGTTMARSIYILDPPDVNLIDSNNKSMYILDSLIYSVISNSKILNKKLLQFKASNYNKL